jgi:hypothetical protein
MRSRESPGGTRPDRWNEAVVVALVAFAYVIPLLFTRYFPGLDLPWQAAAIEVLHRHDASEVSRDFLGYVAVDAQITTYLTMYAAVDLLAFVVGDVAVAIQVLIALYVLAFVWSARRLLRAFGSDGVAAVLAAPAAYSMTMEYGFLTYSLCYPLTFWLWALARELFARPRSDSGSRAPHPAGKRGTHWRLVVIGLLSALIAATHPFAAAVALAGAGLILATHVSRPDARLVLLAGLVLAAGALPAVVALSIIGGAAPPPLWRAHPGASLWDKLTTQRFVALSESLATAPVRLFGFMAAGWCFVLAAAGLVAAVVSRHFGARPEREAGVRGRAALWLVAFMVAAYLATPFTFEWPRLWYGVQPRLLPIVWVLALVLVRARGTMKRPALAVLPPVAVSGVALLILVATVFAPFAREAADFRRVIAHSAPRARTLGLIEQPRTRDREPASPWRHSTAYVLVEHGGGYASSLLIVAPAAGKAWLPVRPADDAPPLPRATHPGFPRSFDWALYGREWDQFLIRDGDPSRPFDYFGAHSDDVRLLARSGRWRLYANRRP